MDSDNDTEVGEWSNKLSLTEMQELANVLRDTIKMI